MYRSCVSLYVVAVSVNCGIYKQLLALGASHHALQVCLYVAVADGSDVLFAV